IIQVYDFGVDGDGPYYTMELLEGADLRSQAPLPWREVCAYLRDIASSLALLHSRRLLHCDVSVSNIWLTSEKRAKLLDFGALADFGRNSFLAGSPPTTAPEVVAAQDLDQRVDLYALGASAYFALTRRHAYPASSMALLPAMWEAGRPAPPSSYVPEIPAELDRLVLALLEHDRMLRPTSAAEVIDRLEVIAGLTPDRDPRVLRSYLQSAVAIGRDAQRRVLHDTLRQALAGSSRGVLIEGTPGLGKSLMLKELEQQARVGGARVLSVHAHAHAGALGLWSALMSEAGGTRTERASLPTGPEALLALAETTPLVVCIEDLHEADTESLAALLGLVKAARRSRLMFASTVDPSRPEAVRPALRLLRSNLTSVELTPFDEKTTHALVTALFGDVPSASRLATFLYDQAAGNPQTSRAIIDHLIDQGFIRYVDGIWILPTELPAVGPGGLDLGALVHAALAGRTAHWRPALRCLGQCLSPTRGPIDMRLCELLAADESELDKEDLQQVIAELVREGVLVEDLESCSFARSADQEFFYAQLDPGRRRAKHLALAREYERRAASDLKRTFEAGFHFLLAGELKKARVQLNRDVDASLGNLDILIHSVPDLWALLKHQRAAGASDEEVQFIEGLLVIAAYYVDPKICDDFGERTLRTMHRTMGFALASRLAPWLGAHLALAVGLLVAWVRSWLRTPYLLTGPKFATAMMTFVAVCVSVNVSACARFDRRGITLVSELLDVTRKLGRYDILRFIYDQLKMGEELLIGYPARARAQLIDQLERLPKLRGLTEDAHHQFEVGLLFVLGLNSLLRMDPSVPELIARVDALGSKHDRMQAQFLRLLYQLYQGDPVAAKREEERFDELSSQFGSRWSTDIHVALAFTPFHLAGDVLALKRALHRVEALLPTAPKLDFACTVLRAMYEGHRGRPDLALRHYDQLGARLAPYQDALWAHAIGHKAECLNTLGRHAEALALCDENLAQLSPDDYAFVFTVQQIRRERSLALAALGRFAEAVAVSDELLSECASGTNLLIRGLLHFDRARIAKLAGDTAALEEHAAAARADLTAIHNASAIARVNRMFDPRGESAARGMLAAEDHAGLLKDLIDTAQRNQAARVLQEIGSTAQARSARLYLVLYRRPVLCAEYGVGAFDTAFEAELGRLAGKLDGEQTESMISEVLSDGAATLGQGGRLLPLMTSSGRGHPELVALVALEACARPEALAELDLTLLAAELRTVDEATEAVYGGGEL
ncbi:MAG TPA: AAA family ATPase, partial [Polyangiales bacterium]